MNVVMIGAGYVGLTTGACLAELGHRVVCIDTDAMKIARLKRAEVPIYEPGLSELIRRHMMAGRLAFSDDLASAAPQADAIFIAVGTPSDDDGDIDLSYVKGAAAELAPLVKSDAVIVIKSTVVAGTARMIANLVAEIRGDSDVHVASNPEFLREGSAIGDFLEADRIVIGADDARSADVLAELYAPLRKKGVPFVTTTTTNAELVKYAANAFLALKIGFINEVADLCEAADGDVAAVAEGIGLDRRIGRAFLNAGPGFGGSCFPKDTRAFAATGRRYRQPQTLVETLIQRNEARKAKLAAKIIAELGRKGGRVAVLGTAFKSNTDDVRDSAALTVIPALLDAGIAVVAHDPKARKATERLVPGAAWRDCPYEAARDADALVILTEWDDYARLDLRRISGLMAGRSIVDCRNLFAPHEVTRHGLKYVSIGRRPATPTTRQKAKRAGAGAGNWSDIAAAPA
ncbi:UDP-glucose/GDP-mannose dehydrogenase family protein [Pseudorhizobium endolithicum]|uniref:UDP-glucose 6-dehydrogenase n=1 Tax=Pseudorhizobium endolithicum TaxID=1191678 RepID=A0ABM8PPZ1_9HYPH|nr:UDP-glucose/GDP-mannose dehydrogenase family protein [Pseudorhizobium endolithicum]CAD7041677.1 UDP-glucose/GDP-mannose dehydrogenase family protein [Pseudorhizobium endolithicum]